MPDLEYEPTPAARGAFVERDGAVTRVVVPMPGLYVPTPLWIWELQWISLVLGPLVWASVLAARTLAARPKPPRAVFELDATTLRVTLRHPSTGKVLRVAWPREAIATIRATRDDDGKDGLWVDVDGYVRDTYLPDLPRRTIAQIETMLAAAMRRDGTATPT